jgi:hypothetical protein
MAMLPSGIQFPKKRGEPLLPPFFRRGQPQLASRQSGLIDLDEFVCTAFD